MIELIGEGQVVSSKKRSSSSDFEAPLFRRTSLQAVTEKNLEFDTEEKLLRIF